MKAEIDVNKAISLATAHANRELMKIFKDPDRSNPAINREWKRMRDKRVSEYMGWDL